jgi:PAS domain-containing protein
MPTGKKKHLMDPDLAHRYDFDLRKCIHIRLFKRTKNELDIMKARLNLPLQEIFQCLAQAVIDENPYIITMLNEHRIKKENSQFEKRFSDSDAESLLEVIAKNSPFKDEDDDDDEYED